MADESRVAEACARQGLASTWPPTETIRPSLALSLEGLAALDSPTLGTIEPVQLPDARTDLELGEVFAKGGMSWIRRATQRALGREVAVKSLPDRARSETRALALLREARITGRLEHPGIVPVHQLGHAPDGSPVIVMKRIDGASWHELIHQPGHRLWAGLDEQERPLRHLEILLDVCLALELAHSRGVVHRDVKPQNVMVGSYGEVYLLDWGVALDRAAGEQSRDLAGTPAYMAPEMADPGREIDARTDVYLLGATLHEVLTGKPRHAGADVHEVLVAALRSEPAVYPAAQRGLGAICNRACHPEPEARYPTVAALRRDIVAYRDRRGSVRLAERAQRQLEELERRIEERAEPLLVHRAYSACRFGFEQALRDWPDNPPARGGLQRTLEQMVAYELTAGRPGSARLLLADLPTPAPLLVAQVASAERGQERNARARQTLEQLRWEMRFSGTDWRRTAITALNGVVGAGLLCALGAARRAHGEISPGANLLFAVGLTLLLGVGIVIGRRALLDNAVYRRMMLTFALLGPLMIATRLLGRLVEAPFPQVLLADCMVALSLMVAVAVFVERLFWLSVAAALVAVGLALSHLDYAFELLATGHVAVTAQLGWVLRPQATPRAPSLPLRAGNEWIPPSVDER